VSIVQSKPGTTPGGITGKGFLPGQSGNPSGRPRGLSRRVRELVGDDGEAIADFMFDLMNDPNARNADRIEAARWLADRAFGRSIQGVDLTVNQVTLEDLFRGMTTEDLAAVVAVYEKYDVVELVESGAVASVVDPTSLTPARRR